MSRTAQTYDDKAMAGLDIETLMTSVASKIKERVKMVDVSEYTSAASIEAVATEGSLPYYAYDTGSVIVKIPYVGKTSSRGGASLNFCAIVDNTLYRTYFIYGAYAFGAVSSNAIITDARLRTSSDSTNWSNDDTNVPTRAAVDAKISDAVQGNVGGFMGVYSVSGINYMISFAGYNFRMGDWFSMYDSGTVSYYQNNDRTGSSIALTVNAGDDVYWTTSGILLVRNTSSYATKSDLARKAPGFTCTINAGKALKITIPWATRSGRTSFIIHWPGNNGKGAVVQLTTFKDTNAAMSALRAMYFSYSGKGADDVPVVYYSANSNSAQSIYITRTTSSGHVVTVMPTCQNIDSITFEEVDSSEATYSTTEVSNNMWAVYGSRGCQPAYTAKYDSTGDTVDATTFAELVDAYYTWTDNILLYRKYTESGLTKRRLYRLTDVQSDRNGNYTKFVFSRTNLGEESLANVGMQEIFSCTSSGWTMTTSDIFKSHMADFATQASYYPNIDTPETPISIRESMEARLVADTPTVRVPSEPTSGERKTYLTSCLFTRLPDVSAYSNHIGTNANYINLNDFMSWNTPSDLIKAGQVFAIWNTRSSDVRLYLGSSTSADYMTVKAGRIGFVGTWDGMNYKLMTQ